VSRTLGDLAEQSRRHAVSKTHQFWECLTNGQNQDGDCCGEFLSGRYIAFPLRIGGSR
jgi:hypothetical protein